MNASESLIKAFENMRFGDAIRIEVGIVERLISPLTKNGELWVGINKTKVDDEKFADPELIIFSNQDDAEKNANPLFKAIANSFNEISFNFIGMIVPREPLPKAIAQMTMEVLRWYEVK